VGMNFASTLIAILRLSTTLSDLIRSTGGTNVKPRFRRFISMLSILWQYLQCQLNARESSAVQRSSSHRKETGWPKRSSRHYRWTASGDRARFHHCWRNLPVGCPVCSRLRCPLAYLHNSLRFVGVLWPLLGAALLCLNLEYDEICYGNICYPGGYVAYIVINVLLLGPFTLWKIWRAFQEKRERRTWLLFGALVVVCMSLDNTVTPNWLLPDPIMALPWLYLICRWASPYVMDWCKKRTSKKDSIASEVRDPALQPANPD